MRCLFSLLAFAASAFAYSVIEPSSSSGWTTTGPNVVTWQSVSTDPANFTIVLDNQVQLPHTTQVLDALVVGSLGKITVNPPSGGWKAGKGFRVNLVANTESLNTILAQSDQFDIITPNVTSSTFFASTTAAASAGTVVAPVAATTTDTDSQLDPTETATNGAFSLRPEAAGLAGLLAVFYAFLA